MLGYSWYTQYLSTYLQGVYDLYSDFQNAVYITFYHNNPVEYDEQSMSAYTLPSGPYAPNQYHQIVGLPLFMSTDLAIPINVRGETGYETPNPSFTGVMIAPTGVIPMPDDYIAFDSPNPASPTTIYRITQVEPAIMFTANPMTELLQFFRVTCQVDPLNTLSLNTKVVQSSFYVSKFKQMISLSAASLFASIMQSLTQLEEQINTYLLVSPNLLTLNSYCYYDLTSLFYMNQLIPMLNAPTQPLPWIGSINSIQYQILNTSFSTPASAYSSPTQSYTTIDALSTTNAQPLSLDYYSSNLFLTNQIQQISPTMINMFLNRRVLLPTDTPNEVFPTLTSSFYPNYASEVWNILLSILNDRYSGTYTLINSPLNLALIYNEYVNKISNNDLSPWSTQAQNIFEMVFLYALQQRVLVYILNYDLNTITNTT
jgi:hypothetical protein